MCISIRRLMLIVPINSSGFAIFDLINGRLSGVCSISCYGVGLESCWEITLTVTHYSVTVITN